MTFVKPKDKVTKENASEYSNPFQVSSRIKALINQTSKSIGASCNVFHLEDTMQSIGESRYWSIMVQAHQGAPSIDFSSIRPKGSVLKSGGTASGAVSFMKGFDADLSVIRREEKKNSSGIAYLSWNHPELESFLDYPTEVMYKAVYVPQPGTPEAELLLANEDLVDKLVQAYDYFKCFLVKRPPEGLYANLCTEVLIPHKGFCILGAVNLAAFSWHNLRNLSRVFRSAMMELSLIAYSSRAAAKDTGILDCPDKRNKQVGLGIFGLASFLGTQGITYEELATHLSDVFEFAGANAGIEELLNSALDLTEANSPVSIFVYQLLAAYYEATKVAKEFDLRAAFCIQPTVSTAHRCFDSLGFYSSPEIQPVRGLKTEDSTRTILKSQIKGDKIIDYAPGTWTLEDVPYETYRQVSEYFQRIMNATGLAHRHSHCWYGEKFTREDFFKFFNSDIQNLYYRLPYQINNDAVDKSKLWQSIEGDEITGDDVDLDSLFTGESCGIQKFEGEEGCPCQM